MEKKEKEYDYFISYYYDCTNGQQGWGNTNIVIDKKITNYDILRQVSNFIKKQNNFKEVVITNYILLK